MRFAVRLLSCTIFALFCSASFGRDTQPTTTRSLTVLLDFEEVDGGVSLHYLQSDLQMILGFTGLTFDVRAKDRSAEHSEFSQLVVFKMKGHCTARPLPIGALSDERGALAMTYSSDGTLLPFGEVECDRVRQSLQRTLGSEGIRQHPGEYNRAIASVMAHEIYHMVGHTARHTNEGLTKESLSSQDLYNGNLALSLKAQRQLMRQIGPR